MGLTFAKMRVSTGSFAEAHAEALEAKSKPAAKPRAPKPDLSDDEIEQGVLRRLHVAGALGS